MTPASPQNKVEKLMRTVLSVGVACLTVIAAGSSHMGCAHRGSSTSGSVVPHTPDAKPAKKVESDTAVQAGDSIEIEVFGEKDLSGKFQISNTGTIDYPLVGRIHVGGMQPTEIATTLRTKLAAGYLKKPYVRVSVEDYLKRRKIYVWGQVEKSGTFNYINGMTLIEALTLAGGLTPLAASKDITLTRVENAEQRRYGVPMNKGQSANYALQAGDVIFVPESVF